MPPVTEPRTRVGRRWQDAPVRRRLLTLVATIARVSLPPIGVGLVLDARPIDAKEAAAQPANVSAGPTVFAVDDALVDLPLSALDSRSTAYEAVEEPARRTGAQLPADAR